jgi:hypothetical protein
MSKPVRRQNVTLSLPAEVLRQVRHLAVERGMSLSRFLAWHLEVLIHNESAYEQARERAVTRMRQGLPMGVGPTPAWTRDELHER